MVFSNELYTRGRSGIPIEYRIQANKGTNRALFHVLLYISLAFRFCQAFWSFSSSKSSTKRCPVVLVVCLFWTPTKANGNWFGMASFTNSTSNHHQRFIGSVRRRVARLVFILIWIRIMYARIENIIICVNRRKLKSNAFGKFSRVVLSTKQHRSAKYTTKRLLKLGSHRKFLRVCRWFVISVKSFFYKHQTCRVVLL